MNTKLLSILVAGLGFSLIASTAQAAPTPAPAPGYCNLGQATENIAPANMTFNRVPANDCYGIVDGNLAENAVAPYANAEDPYALNSPLWGGEWAYLLGTGAKTNNPIGDITFSLTAGIGSDEGTWTLTATDSDPNVDPNLPLYLDFAATLKGGNELAFWFFDDREVDLTNAGTFKIVFTNNGDNTPGLSHMDILWRYGEEPENPPPPPPPPQEVPEPGPLALLGLGLTGLWVIRRRKQS